MKSSISFALLAAVPLGAANFWICPFPIDSGYPADTPWCMQALGLRWVLLHWLGIRADLWFLRSGFSVDDRLILFAGGYLEIALLLIAGVICLDWLRRLCFPAMRPR